MALGCGVARQTQGWEPLWADLDALSQYWRTPEPAVVAWAEQLWQAGGRQVLDLGCGIGRHTVALSRMGFAVTATDVSPSGLATCGAWLDHEGLGATLVHHEMEALPFPNSSCDGLIAYNVIYHTTVAGMQRVLTEVHRVLRPGGQFYTTVIARDEDNVAFYRADMEAGKCQEIEPFTFVYLREAPGDKHLPHHHCDEPELRALLAGFAVDHLRLVRKEYADADGTICVGVHYHVQAWRP